MNLITRTLSFTLSLRSAALGATERESVHVRFVLEYRGPLLAHERATAEGIRRLHQAQEIGAEELRRILQFHLGDWKFGAGDQPGSRHEPYDEGRRLSAQEALLTAVHRALELVALGRTVSLTLPDTDGAVRLKLYPDRT